MNTPLPQWVARIIIGILIICLGIASFLLWRQYTIIRHSDTVQQQRIHLNDIRHRGPLTATDVHYIDTWMTFEYISMIYNVPQQYLKTALSIQDPLFPHLSINHYARDIHGDSSIIISDTQRVVSTYLTTGTTTVH